MHSNPKIVEKLRAALKGKRGIQEKVMFGGACFFLNGNICVGVYHDWLIARVGGEAAAKGLKDKHISPMDITGRPMKGWLMVSLEGDRGDKRLKKWVDAAVVFVSTLSRK